MSRWFDGPIAQGSPRRGGRSRGKLDRRFDALGVASQLLLTPTTFGRSPSLAGSCIEWQEPPADRRENLVDKRQLGR